MSMDARDFIIGILGVLLLADAYYTRKWLREMKEANRLMLAQLEAMGYRPEAGKQ